MTAVFFALAGPTSPNLSRVGAAGPSGSQTGLEAFFLSPSSAATITIVAVVVAIVASITLKIYCKRHKSEMLAEKNKEVR